MIHRGFNSTLGNFLRLFVRKVNGLDNVPENGPYIIASNHDSYLDPLIIDAVFYRKINQKIHWLAMKGRFWNIFGERIARKWAGCVPLDEGKKKALKELTNLLIKGDNVGIFPGGPRSLDGNLTEGKTGISRLVLGARVPVIPVGLTGTFDIAPRNKLIPKLKRTDVNIGKPIYFTTYFGKYFDRPHTKRMLKEIVDKVMREIAKLTGRRYDF